MLFRSGAGMGHQACVRVAVRRDGGIELAGVAGVYLAAIELNRHSCAWRTAVDGSSGLGRRPLRECYAKTLLGVMVHLLAHCLTFCRFWRKVCPGSVEH